MVSLNYRTAISHHASFSAIEAVPHWLVVRPKKSPFCPCQEQQGPASLKAPKENRLYWNWFGFHATIMWCYTPPPRGGTFMTGLTSLTLSILLIPWRVPGLGSNFQSTTTRLS